MLGSIAALWGFLGVSVFLGTAIYRLGQISLQTLESPLSWYHWLTMAVCVLFFGVFEGYRGFQKGYSPRVAARVLYLSKNVTPVRFILAPVFCMGYFHARRARQIVSICVTLGIIVLVQLVHFMPQPWRGILDTGVVVGLSWGLIAFWLFTIQAFVNPAFDYSPETP